jgi:hypothetical protein
LGILDLDRFAHVLRLRWFWLEWTAPDKPWVGLETPNDEVDRNLFSAATKVTLGDGHKASFWTSSWLEARSTKLVAPLIYEASKRKKRTVHDALANNRSIADVSVANFSVEHMTQFITLWGMLQDVVLLPGTPDTISWTLAADGVYSVGSAYKAQFQGSTSCSFKQIIWKVWAPPKCRFFAWLAVQNRLWTSDRLAIRGWPHQPTYQLCRCQPETARHILFECRFSKHIWQQAASWLSCPSLLNDLRSGRGTVLEYWHAITASPSACPKGLKSAVILIGWELWKERNARVFNNKASLPLALMQKIKDEGKNWIIAGAKHLAEITS